MGMLSLVMTIEEPRQRDKFTAIYQAYRYTMLYVARAILKNQSEAEDAVHDAFLKIIEIIDQIGDVTCSKTKSLIVIIVKNKAIDRFRRDRRLDQQPIEDYEYTLADEGETPDDAVISQQGYERLIQAIGTLGERYKTVMELKYLHGYTNSEVGKILDIEPKTVNMRLYRAKGKLREILEKEGEPLGR